jgi:hypothetical protein
MHRRIVALRYNYVFVKNQSLAGTTTVFSGSTFLTEWRT